MNTLAEDFAGEQAHPPGESPERALVIATILRAKGSTGVQTYFSQLQQYLSSQSSSVTVVTPFSRDRLLSTPLFALRLLIRPISRPASVRWYRHWHQVFLRRGLRSCLSDRPDAIVYAQCPVSALVALQARSGPEQRVVMAVHFQVSQADEWVVKGEIKQNCRVFRSIRQSERETFPRLDGMVFISTSAMENFACKDVLDHVRSAVIPNFVFLPPAESSPHPDADLVSIGCLEQFKNHDFLLEVLAAANRKGRRYTLDIIGAGPRRRALLRQARSLGVESQVRLLGYRPDARNLLAGYRAYVHASRSETLPLAIVEALAAGLPVIAGAVGGIPELFSDAIEGRYWPLDDAEAAAAILIAVMDEESERLRFGAAARSRFDRQFDAHTVGPTLQAFLRSVSSPEPQVTPVAQAANEQSGEAAPGLIGIGERTGDLGEDVDYRAAVGD